MQVRYLAYIVNYMVAFGICLRPFMMWIYLMRHMTSVYECDNFLQQASSDRPFCQFFPFVVQMTGSLREMP